MIPNNPVFVCYCDSDDCGAVLVGDSKEPKESLVHQLSAAQWETIGQKHYCPACVIARRNRRVLDRQDLVDNAIFTMLQAVTNDMSHTDSPIVSWDIELIGNVRDIVQQELCNKYPNLNWSGFYPFIDEDTSKEG